ncbi:MAG: response regulator [Chloroflexota bacterium]
MKKKILIVEDNPQNMRLMEMVLQSGGYALVKAGDGPEALQTAQRERPDLIIMDIQLPEMSGLEVTRRLRQDPELRQVPIIAVTAYAMKGDRERFLEAGCTSYISKPIDTRKLPLMVAGMLGGRR